MRKRDHLGVRFGQLVVIARSPIKGRNAYWDCRCDCGRVRAVCAGHLTQGKITSCGCYRAKLVSAALTKHGGRKRGSTSAIYNTWVCMKERCYNVNNPSYPGYGGRGITVCDRWRHDFAAFLADMGPKPSPTHSLDRVDNNGPYAPENCRWATASEQAFNRRRKGTAELRHRHLAS